ncbi:hypothetical protein [Chondromyces crocatus]|uniref:hypothetical protein n=1 Tax=Chondromyces crocatus TaxID=52 RepID=UPI0012E20C80|nr:hypothetical protein [Chondromyces crocatus]
MERFVALLHTLLLGEAVVVNGIHVRRASLLGFQVAGATGLLEARDAARRIGRLAKTRPVRIALCSRCGGDGLGRRDRGSCGLCKGSGLQITEPPLGWRDAMSADLAAGARQARAALATVRHPRAKASLLTLLGQLEAGALRDSA